MDSQINEYPLEGCMDAIIDYRGKTPKKTASGVPLITAKIVKNGRILPYEEYISEDDYDDWMRRGLPKCGDILLTTEAPLGEVAQIKDPCIALAQRLILLRGKKGVLDNNYLKYLLSSNEIQGRLNTRSSGTTVIGIKQSELRKILLPLPPLSVQKKIASILNSLDDKVELNTHMNKVLEEIARALFHRWFVEFEFPDAEGRLYKSSGGKMVESEMGIVPEGWEVGTLGDIIELSYGKPLKKKNRTGEGFPVFGSNGVVGWHKEWLVSGPGIIIGRKGNAGTVTWSSENFFPIDTTFYVVPKSGGYNFFYIYYLLKRLNLPYLTADSAVPGLNRNAALIQHILIPDTYTIKEYEISVSSLFSQIYSLELENRSLIEIRDALLPKLMNGEIPLSENFPTIKKLNPQENK